MQSYFRTHHRTQKQTTPFPYGNIRNSWNRLKANPTTDLQLYLTKSSATTIPLFLYFTKSYSKIAKLLFSLLISKKTKHHKLKKHELNLSGFSEILSLSLLISTHLSGLPTQQKVGCCDLIILHPSQRLVDLLTRVTHSHHYV